jgi:guanylate kinase
MVRLKIGLDWDDVVAPFNSLAIRLANEKYGTDLALEDIDSWENTGKASVIKEFYGSDELYDLQAVSIPQERINTVRRLEEIADVYFITAVYAPFMTKRAELIQKTFPELGQERIILGAAKSLVQFDMVLDDNICNVLDSKAEYPVLMRKPWNKQMTGLLSVNNLDEFVTLVEHILEGGKTLKSQPAIHIIVGPSGSRKRDIAAILNESENFSLVKSYSTKKCPEYSYMSPEDFKKNLKTNEFIEHTFYGGYEYGTLWKDVMDIYKSHLGGDVKVNPVMILDICGAIGIKRQYKNTRVFYIKRNKVDIVRSIVSDNTMSDEEKTIRLLSVEAEKKNEKICDQVITAKEENFAEDCARQIMEEIE